MKHWLPGLLGRLKWSCLHCTCTIIILQYWSVTTQKVVFIVPMRCFLLGKGWTLGSFVCCFFLCFCHFLIWCLGTGVVLSLNVSIRDLCLPFYTKTSQREWIIIRQPCLDFCFCWVILAPLDDNSFFDFFFSPALMWISQIILWIAYMYKRTLKKWDVAQVSYSVHLHR